MNQNPSGTGSKPGAVGAWTDAQYAQMIASGDITNSGPPTHATDLPASVGGSGSRGLGDRGGSVDVGVPESGGIGSPGLPDQIAQPGKYAPQRLISSTLRTNVARPPSGKSKSPFSLPTSQPKNETPQEISIRLATSIRKAIDANSTAYIEVIQRTAEKEDEFVKFMENLAADIENESNSELTQARISEYTRQSNEMRRAYGELILAIDRFTNGNGVNVWVKDLLAIKERDPAYYKALINKFEEEAPTLTRLLELLITEEENKKVAPGSSSVVSCPSSSRVAAAEMIPSAGSSDVGVLSQNLVSDSPRSGSSDVGVRIYGRDIDRLGEVFSSKGLLVGRCDEQSHEVAAGSELRVDLGSLCDWKAKAVGDVQVSLVKGSEVKDLAFREKALAYASGVSSPLFEEVYGRPWWAEAMIDPARFPSLFSRDNAEKPAFGTFADRVEIDKEDGMLEYQTSKNDLLGESAVVVRFTDSAGRTRVVTIAIEVTDHSPVCGGVARDLVDRYGVKKLDGLDTGGVFGGESSDDRLVVERGSWFRAPVGECFDVDDDVAKEVFSGSDSDLLKPSAGKDENGDPGVVFGVPSDRVGSVGDVRVQAVDEGGREARVSVPVVVKDVPYVCQTTKGRLVVHVVPGVEKHVDVPCALKNGVRPLAVVKSQFGVFEDRNGVFRTDISQVTGAVSFDVSVNQGVVGTVTRSLTLFNGDLRTSVPVDLVVDDGTQSSQAGSGSSSGAGGSGGKYAPPMDSPGPSSPVPPVSGDGKTGGGSSVPSSSGGKKPVKGDG